MGTVTSVVDPAVLFDRWFEKPIALLETLPSGDGGTAGMMIVLPLFERYIDILEANDPVKRKRYEIMAAELKLASADEAEKFWTLFRHGFCHTGMPLERGRKIRNLPKPVFAGHFSAWPVFNKLPNGDECVCLDPWKFICHVMDIYRQDPSLLARHPDAPLLSIVALT